MASSKVIDINRPSGARANKLISRFHERLGHNSPFSGLPELGRFPKLLSRYVGLPELFKEKPANTAHIVALAQMVFEVLAKMAKEIDDLKKERGKR